MWIKKLRWILLSLLTLTHAPLILACEISALSIQPNTTQPKYDILNTNSFATINTYSVSANIAGESCEIDLILQLNDSSTSLKGATQEALKFNWTGQIGKTVANQWHLSLTDAQPTTTVEMRFPSKQWLTPGVYEGLLEMSLNPASNDKVSDFSPITQRVSVSVPPSAKIHYYGLSNNHYDLVLGELSSNKVISSSPKLLVESNSAYTVILASAHQGVLRHESHNSKWDIPYQLTLDNEAVDLAEVDAYIKRRATKSNKPIAVNFIIGDTKNKPGGQYEDILEISIEPDLSQQPFF